MTNRPDLYSPPPNERARRAEAGGAAAAGRGPTEVGVTESGAERSPAAERSRSGSRQSPHSRPGAADTEISEIPRRAREAEAGVRGRDRAERGEPRRYRDRESLAPVRSLHGQSAKGAPAIDARGNKKNYGIFLGYRRWAKKTKVFAKLDVLYWRTGRVLLKSLEALLIIYNLMIYFSFAGKSL